ncbi:MAG: antibiotic biosynthesis monooxygenase [Leptospiraceae bacterium]|nr:antibiotic biosynthesis monooxygenase [Leptospiraceae bacterium]
MKKIILKGYILVPKKDLDKIKLELLNHIELTKKEKGYLVFEVSQDKNELNKFNVYEEFINEEAFEIHQKRVIESKWGEITKDCKRYYEVREG